MILPRVFPFASANLSKTGAFREIGLTLLTVGWSKSPKSKLSQEDLTKPTETSFLTLTISTPPTSST